MDFPEELIHGKKFSFFEEAKAKQKTRLQDELAEKTCGNHKTQLKVENYWDNASGVTVFPAISSC